MSDNNKYTQIGRIEFSPTFSASPAGYWWRMAKTPTPKNSINVDNDKRIEKLEKALADISDIVHGDTSNRSVDEICDAIGLLLEIDEDE